MENIDTRILDKIKKCLALSQSSEPHEAAAALRQAQKLMEIHGVSQLQLKLADIGEARVQSRASATKPKDWETGLLALVGKAFGCKMMWDSGYPYGHFIYIGLKQQVTLAEYTFMVMQRKLMRGRAEFVAGLPTFNRATKTVEADGYCKGWVSAVSKTVHAFALTKETEAMIDEVKDRRSAGKEQEVQERQAGTHGLRAGFEAGTAESIHRPMAEQKRTMIGHKP